MDGGGGGGVCVFCIWGSLVPGTDKIRRKYKGRNSCYEPCSTRVIRVIYRHLTYLFILLLVFGPPQGSVDGGTGSLRGRRGTCVEG